MLVDDCEHQFVYVGSTEDMSLHCSLLCDRLNKSFGRLMVHNIHLHCYSDNVHTQKRESV